ncbi:hypothetical protein J6590_049352 [Homalodisca vitripennis]|nr:hypothetical protein J6590_049352 [Homalodisca vitripennis]
MPTSKAVFPAQVEWREIKEGRCEGEMREQNLLEESTLPTQSSLTAQLTHKKETTLGDCLAVPALVIQIQRSKIPRRVPLAKREGTETILKEIARDCIIDPPKSP